MTHTTRRAAMARTLMAFGASALPAGFAQAQTYPSKTIRIITPFAVGGTSGAVGRLLAHKLSEAMKQSVIVESKPGASGIVGSDLVAKAAPDGYTMLITSQQLVQAPAFYSTVPFDPLRDLIPLSDLFSSPLWLAVNTSRTSARTVKEFVAQVKSQPRQHSYGSAGAGSIGSLYGHQLNEMAGLDMVHVPYKGAGPNVLALLAGEVSASFVDYSTFKAHAATGKVRALAVSTAARSQWTPDVATFTEQGFPGFESFSWVGIFVTGKTPPDVVQKLSSEIIKALKDPEMVAKLREMSLDQGGMEREKFAAMVAADHARWGAIIKASGIKPE